MKRPEKIDAVDLPDVSDEILVAATNANFRYVVKKHNELVDIVNELMDAKNEKAI